MHKADLRYNKYKKYGGILIFVKFVFYKELEPNLRKCYKESESTVFTSLEDTTNKKDKRERIAKYRCSSI